MSWALSSIFQTRELSLQKISVNEWCTQLRLSAHIPSRFIWKCIALAVAEKRLEISKRALFRSTDNKYSIKIFTVLYLTLSFLFSPSRYSLVLFQCNSERTRRFASKMDQCLPQGIFVWSHRVQPSPKKTGKKDLIPYAERFVQLYAAPYDF